MRVQGWMARTVAGEAFVNVSAEIEDLVIPVGSKDPAKATTDISFACNLDKATPEIPVGATVAEIEKGTWATSFDVYDSFGRVHKLQANFQKVPGTANRWQVDVAIDPDAAVGDEHHGRGGGGEQRRPTGSSSISTTSARSRPSATPRATS